MPPSSDELEEPCSLSSLLERSPMDVDALCATIMTDDLAFNDTMTLKAGFPEIRDLNEFSEMTYIGECGYAVFADCSPYAKERMAQLLCSLGHIVEPHESPKVFVGSNLRICTHTMIYVMIHCGIERVRIRQYGFKAEPHLLKQANAAISKCRSGLNLYDIGISVPLDIIRLFKFMQTSEGSSFPEEFPMIANFGMGYGSVRWRNSLGCSTKVYPLLVHHLKAFTRMGLNIPKTVKLGRMKLVAFERLLKILKKRRRSHWYGGFRYEVTVVSSTVETAIEQVSCTAGFIDDIPLGYVDISIDEYLYFAEIWYCIGKWFKIDLGTNNQALSYEKKRVLIAVWNGFGFASTWPRGWREYALNAFDDFTLQDINDAVNIFGSAELKEAYRDINRDALEALELSNSYDSPLQHNSNFIFN